jgi:hypothetical protein
MRRLLIWGSLAVASLTVASKAQAQVIILNEEGDVLTIEQITADPDPFGTFTVSFTDFGAASNFSAKFSYPINPLIAGEVNVTASLGGTMTDGGLSGGLPNIVSLTPIDPTMGTSTYVLKGAGGSLSLDFGLGNSQQSGPGSTAVYGAFDTSGVDPANLIYDCNSSLIDGCTGFDILLKFKGSGGGDNYAFTGRMDVLPVLANAVAVLSSDIPPSIAIQVEVNGKTIDLPLYNTGNGIYTSQDETTPEPSTTAVLLGFGLLGLTRLLRSRVS